MVSRAQITLGDELHRKARERAAQLGVSLAEYLRRLVTRDLERPETQVDVSLVFDLGSSAGGDIATDKDAMLGEAAAALASHPTAHLSDAER